MKKRLLGLAVLLLSVNGFAQGYNGNPKYEAEGRLLIFRIVPADKSAKIFLVGRKAGELNLGKDARLISVTTLRGSQAEELKFNGDGTSYEVSLPSKETDLTLTLKAEIRGQPDHVKIKIKKP